MTELANPDARYWFPIEEGYAHLDDQGVARIKTIIKKSVEPLAKADSRGRLGRGLPELVYHVGGCDPALLTL